MSDTFLNEEEFDDLEIELEDDDDEGDQEEEEREEKEKDLKAQDKEEPEEALDKKPSRAERRINKLVGRAKNLETQLSEREQELKRLRSENEELRTSSSANQSAALAEAESRIKSTEEALKAEWLKAADSDDLEKQFDIQSKLATVKAERLNLEAWKSQNPTEDEQKPRKEGEKDEPRIDPDVARRVRGAQQQAQRWWRDNQWFKLDNAGTAESPDMVPQNEMSELAMDIHEDLKKEGYDPMDDPDQGQRLNDYYLELNRRLRDEKPDFFKAERGKRANGSGQDVAGRGEDGRSTRRTGKNVVKLSAREVAFCKRNDIDPKAYAIEKQKIAARDQ